MLTGEGSPFELEMRDIDGIPLRVFRHAPASLREVWLEAAGRGDVPYFVFGEQILTYGEVDRQVRSLATWMSERGVRAGDRVAIGMRNYPEWAVAFWAAQCIGAVVVSLNAWWVTDELRFAIEDSGARTLVLDGERLGRLDAGLLADTGVENVVVVRAPARAGTVAWEEATGRTGAALPEARPGADDAATIFYTSGTTGRPKGALGTQRNYVTNFMNSAFSAALAQAMVGNWPPAPPTIPPSPPRVLSTFPFFHIAGLCGMISNTRNGALIATMHKWDAGEALALVERHRLTSLGGVPTVVRTFMEHPDFPRHDLSSLVAISQGGAPVPPDLVARIETAFAGVVSAGNGYGLTETTGGVVANSGAAYFARKDSVGLPAVGTDVRISGPDGDALPPRTVGEVWIQGPNNVRGYWNRPEATEEAFGGGWFRSGDAGYVDEDGYLYVVDRIKDMVLRGGENVYCVEVETVLFEHPSVLDCAVIGLPHEVLGEEVAAVVVPEHGHGPAAEESLLAHLASRLAPFKVPSIVLWRAEELPRNATGKVLKKDLRDEYAPR
jgi:long-chain acyl-CoA synthetase